jgi:hypothetical protein
VYEGVCVDVSVGISVVVSVGGCVFDCVGISVAVSVAVNVCVNVGVFVAVSVNVYVCVFVGKGTPIARLLLVTIPLVTGHVPAASMPPALACNVTTPCDAAVYIQVNEAAPPAGMVTAIDGPETSVTLPVPAGASAEGNTSEAVPVPVFSTCIITVMVSPVFTVSGDIFITAVRYAPVVAVGVGESVEVSVTVTVGVTVAVIVLEFVGLDVIVRVIVFVGVSACFVFVTVAVDVLVAVKDQ